MLKAFKDRKPLASVFVILTLSPVFGMCYLNRGKLALAYFILEITLAGFAFVMLSDQTIGYGSSLLLRMVAMLHGVFLIRKRDSNEPMRWYSHWYAILALMVALLGSTMLFRSYCYEPFHMASASMSPNLPIGEYIVVEKFAYLHRAPKRADVIAFRHHGVSFIKRIAGLPGETLRLKDGVVFIDDRPLTQKPVENDLFLETSPEGVSYKIVVNASHDYAATTSAYSIPPGHYFVLGDNRSNSVDSRDSSFGLVLQEDILGKVKRIMLSEDR